MSQLDKPREPEHQLSSPDQFLGKMAGVGESAAQNTREFLQQHADLVPVDVIEQIATCEHSMAVDDFKRRRQEGLANENYCDKPGIKVYFTEAGKQAVMTVTAKAGYPIT